MPAVWDQVAETVKQRRVTLGLSQRAAADRAGVSPTTWASLELHHNPVSDITAVGICRALGWTPDSIHRLLSGLGPTEDDEASPPVTLETLAESLAMLRAALVNLTERVEALEPPLPE